MCIRDRSREKGNTIDTKNLENENEKEQDQEGEKLIADLKIRAEKFFGNIAQQQTEELNVETDQKKDNSSKLSGLIASVKEIQSENTEIDKKITPTPKNRTIVSRNFNKKRSAHNLKEIKIKETHLENYKNFFTNSYAENIDLKDKTLTVKNTYQQPVSFEVVDPDHAEF